MDFIIELSIYCLLILLSWGVALKYSKTKYDRFFPSFSFAQLSIFGSEGNFAEILFTVLGTSVGGAIAVGYIGLIYGGGVCYLFISLFFLIGIIVLFSMIPSIKKQSEDNNYLTVEQYLSHDDAKLKILVGIVNIFIFFGLFMAQMSAIKMLLEFRFPQYYLPIYIVLTLAVIGYTTIFGIAGIIKNDIVQTIAILFWIGGIAVVLINDIDSIRLIGTLPEPMLKGTEKGIPALIVGALIIPWTVLARADFWQRIRAAKSVNIAQRAFGFLILTMLCVYLFFAITGLYLAYKFPGNDKESVPYRLLSLMPNMVMYFASVGIYAALVSSADSFLNITSLSLVATIDALKSGSDSYKVHTYRIVSIIVGISALIFSLLKTKLTIWVVWASTGAVILVPGFLGCFLGIQKSKGAHITSIIMGMLGYFLGTLLSHDPEVAFVPASLLAIFSYIFVVVFLRKK